MDVKPARIELSKDKGRPGTKLTVSGVDFAPNELIELHGQGRELRDDIRTDTKGRFSDERVTILQDSAPFFNPYEITAVGRSSGEFDSEEFEVTGTSQSELDEFEPPFDELEAEGPPGDAPAS